jgi:hypothetical protein
MQTYINSLGRNFLSFILALQDRGESIIYATLYLVSVDFKRGIEIDRIPPKANEETLKKHPSIRSETPCAEKYEGYFNVKQLRIYAHIPFRQNLVRTVCWS